MIIQQIHNQVQKIVENKFGYNNSYHYYLCNQSYKKNIDVTVPIQNHMAILIMPIDFTDNQCNQYLALIHHFIDSDYSHKYNGAYLYHVIKGHSKLVVSANENEFYVNKIRDNMFYFPIYQRYKILYLDKWEYSYKLPTIFF